MLPEAGLWGVSAKRVRKKDVWEMGEEIKPRMRRTDRTTSSGSGETTPV